MLRNSLAHSMALARDFDLENTLGSFIIHTRDVDPAISLRGSISFETFEWCDVG
jgi:hypothetical protein